MRSGAADAGTRSDVLHAVADQAVERVGAAGMRRWRDGGAARGHAAGMDQNE